jgi:2-isopropylmalate synthase
MVPIPGPSTVAGLGINPASETHLRRAASGRGVVATSSARQGLGHAPRGWRRHGPFIGDGPIDAVFQAINSATSVAAKLSEFTTGAVTEGQDALGEVSVVLEVGGVAGAGQAVSTDIIDASAWA